MLLELNFSVPRKVVFQKIRDLRINRKNKPLNFAGYLDIFKKCARVQQLVAIVAGYPA